MLKATRKLRKKTNELYQKQKKEYKDFTKIYKK